MKAFIDELMKAKAVTFDESALDAVEIDLSAPTEPTKGLPASP
jgi:hypothetical protein